MTGKPKANDQKAGEGGPNAEGQPGGQGAATTTPPQQKLSTAPPGAPAKVLTPRKPPREGKGKKASAGKPKQEVNAPKADAKKGDPPQKVEPQNKQNQVKGKSHQAEKPPQGAKAPVQQSLFDPEPALNFYTQSAPDIESENDAMVIDTGEEMEDMVKGTKRKAQPMQDAVSSDDDETYKKQKIW